MKMKAKYLVVCLMITFYTALLKGQNISHNISLIESTAERTVLKFTLNEYSFDTIEYQNENYLKIKMHKSALLLKNDAPEVVRLSIPLIVLPDTEYKLNVLSANYTDLEGVNIIPSMGNRKRNQSIVENNFVLGQEYQVDEYYPKKAFQLETPYIFRDFTGQNLSVFPFSYNPVRKTLRVYNDVVISIETKSDTYNKSKYNNTDHISPVFDNLYRSKFVNYNTFKSKNKRYTPFAGQGGILVVANAEFKPVLEPFFTWKKQLGYDVYFVDYQTINSKQELKNTVQEYYENYGVSFLIIAGDNEQVPSFQKVLPDAGLSLCDPVYGHIVGADSYPEVIVGRFSATNAEELQTQIMKTIEYEIQPQFTGDWLSKYTMIASSEGPGDNNEFDFEHLRIIKDDLLDYNYTGGDEMYDGAQGEDDLDGNPTAQMVVDAINEGRGMINYIGHGVSSRFSTSYFSVDNVDALTNTGYYPFIFVVACQAGNFEVETCLAEKLLRASNNGKPTGAVVMLASTIDQDWNPPMLAHDEMIDVLTGQFADNLKHTFGGIVADGCMRMNDGYPSIGKNNTDAWTIFGDPTLSIRTKKTIQLQAGFENSIVYGSNLLKVDCNTDGALVTLLNKNNNYNIVDKQIIENGNAMLDITSLVPQNTTLVLTISKYNHLPLISDIEVIVSDEPNIFVHSVDISDENRNGEIDFAENVSFDITLKNNGLTESGELVAEIKTSSNYIKANTSQNVFGRVGGGQTVTSKNTYDFCIADNIPNLTDIVFEVIISDTESSNTWIDYFTASVNAPQPKIDIQSVSEIEGNGNENMEAGEHFAIEVELANTGNAAAKLANCKLIANENFFTIEKADYSIPFEPNSVQILTFNVLLNKVLPIKTPAILSFELSAGEYIETLTLNRLLRAQKEGFETQLLDTYNWQQNGDADWVITNAEKYSGTFAAKSGVITNNQKSSLSIVHNANAVQTDSIVFFVKVSSESGYDYLYFYIDGEKKQQWSGEVDWQKQTFEVEAGIHTFEWSYVTDESVTEGQNAAWLDNIIFPKSTAQNNSPPVFVSSPVLGAKSNQTYIYSVNVTDKDNDAVSFSLYHAPEWLTILNDSEKVWLYGIPPVVTDEEQYKVVIAATDNKTDVVFQEFYIEVSPDVSVIYESQTPYFRIFPNPARHWFQLMFKQTNQQTISLHIYDLYGKKIETFQHISVDNNITDFISIPKRISSGIYLVKIDVNNNSYYRKLIVY